MQSQNLKRHTNILKKFEYSYGTADLAAGTVDSTKNNGQLGKVESWIGTNKQASQRFGYDELGRLKDAREYRGDNNSLTYKQVFDHDRFGNLYRKAASNPTSGPANPLPFETIEDSDIDRAKNRFTSGTGTTYDDSGQVVTDNKFREMGFAYDGNGRTVKATKTSTPDAWTVYDALGNRVAAKVNDIWNLSIYDAFGKLVAEYGVPIDGPGGLKFVQQDWQGSVRTVTNKAAYVVARTDHQPFGEEISSGVGLRTAQQGFGNASGTTQGYALMEGDAATGQQHTWWRKAETQAGRWTRPDPYNGSMKIGDPRSFNRFAYVQNDPVNYADPSGLDRWGFSGEGSEFLWCQGGSLQWSPFGIDWWDPNGRCSTGGGGNRDDIARCAGGSCGGSGAPPPAPPSQDDKWKEWQECMGKAVGDAKADAIREQGRIAREPFDTLGEYDAVVEVTNGAVCVATAAGFVLTKQPALAKAALVSCGIQVSRQLLIRITWATIKMMNVERTWKDRIPKFQEKCDALKPK